MIVVYLKVVVPVSRFGAAAYCASAALSFEHGLIVFIGEAVLVVLVTRLVELRVPRLRTAFPATLGEALCLFLLQRLGRLLEVLAIGLSLALRRSAFARCVEA